MDGLIPMRGTTTRDRQPAADSRRRWSRRRRVISAILGCLLTGGAAFAATNWLVGLNGGSDGLGQGATIANLSIAATASPSPANLLYPGSTGDVVITISNPNPYPVTITALSLPTNTTYAAGHTNSALTAASGTCTAANSLVAWNYATGVSGSSHTLTTPVTVGASGQANNPLVVTLTGDAVMGSASPAACAGLYFSMPSFTGVVATGGSGASTTSPATSGWTS
jgi:hypothetical protein